MPLTIFLLCQSESKEKKKEHSKEFNWKEFNHRAIYRGMVSVRRTKKEW